MRKEVELEIINVIASMSSLCGADQIPDRKKSLSCFYHASVRLYLYLIMTTKWDFNSFRYTILVRFTSCHFLHCSYFDRYSWIQVHQGQSQMAKHMRSFWKEFRSTLHPYFSHVPLVG
ncbi:hypothetical protein Lalb_Chr09g0330691 [Lupinus albus]|uniref:Uncharacterized protein n=1 Tax=Lupinus albus TaxID=3870 RepID=A0A6A4Q1L0_LUPAL|nr:hypothetical protein Lalb_Chr09g0330691 [Lupinus albus]